MFETKVVEKVKIHILCAITFVFTENHAIYEIMWRNIIELDRPRMTVQYSECVLYAG